MSPFTGALVLIRAHLLDRVIVAPFRHPVRICSEIGFHHRFVRIDTADDVIRCEHYFLACDGLFEAVFLQLHRYGEVVLLD